MAGTHVQRDVRKLDAATLKTAQQVRSEVQAGSWRRNRARMCRVNGLIAKGVYRIGRVIDVWRKRHPAVLLHDRSYVASKAQHEEITLPSFDRRLHRVFKYQLRAARECVTGADHG